MENIDKEVHSTSNEQYEPRQSTARKDSPFADSPYVMNHQPSDVQHSYHPPVQPAAAQPKKNRASGIWKGLFFTVLVLTLVVSSCGLTASIVNNRWEEKSEAMINDLLQQYDQKIQDLQEQINDKSFTGNGNSVSGSPVVSTGLTPGQVYARNKQSVVLVSTTVQSMGQTGTSTGSGFVLSEDGYILTNYHVVEGGVSYTVVLSDGTSYSAKLIGGDDTNDIAVLKADATGLDPVKLGSSDNLIVGDQVVAIGNPLGELTSTLTVGYVSAKDRDITTDGTIINMIQTDAAINSGNSGGPLFNMNGEVIGITTAKYSGSTSSGASIEGIGFAIPIDDVASLIIEIIDKGYVSRPYMGVMVRDMTEFNGVYVDSVENGGSAAAAGVRAGDIIIALGGKEISSVAELTKTLQNYKVGDTATITVYRMRQIVELQITFGEKPHTGSSDSSTPDNSGVPDNGSYDEWFDHFFGNGQG